VGLVGGVPGEGGGGSGGFTVVGFMPVARPIAAWDRPRSSMVWTASTCSAPVRPSRARPVTALMVTVSLAVVGLSRIRQGRSACRLPR